MFTRDSINRKKKNLGKKSLYIDALSGFIFQCFLLNSVIQIQDSSSLQLLFPHVACLWKYLQGHNLVKFLIKLNHQSPYFFKDSLIMQRYLFNAHVFVYFYSFYGVYDLIKLSFDNFKIRFQFLIFVKACFTF